MIKVTYTYESGRQQERMVESGRITGGGHIGLMGTTLLIWDKVDSCIDAVAIPINGKLELEAV